LRSLSNVNAASNWAYAIRVRLVDTGFLNLSSTLTVPVRLDCIVAEAVRGTRSKAKNTFPVQLLKGREPLLSRWKRHSHVIKNIS